MKRAICLSIAFMILIGIVGPALAQGPVNLVRNPSFEGPPVIWENAGEVKSVQDWEPWHWDGLTGYPAISDGNLSSVPTARPEYRPALLIPDPLRVRSGAQSMMWFSFYRNNYAGLLQRDIPVQAGQVYTASVWVQAWSDRGDDPRLSRNEIYFKVGINPRGDCNRTAADTVWNNWEGIGATFERVESQPVRMIGSKACLVLAGGTKYSEKHNDLYTDDAEMTMVAGVTGTCPVCPDVPACPNCPACPPNTGDCLTKADLETSLAAWFGKIPEILEEVLRNLSWAVR